jgi:hypothetical protein
MTNAKKPAKPAAKIEIRMLCILSGDGEEWNPGDKLAVDADEAARLVGLGAAEFA